MPLKSSRRDFLKSFALQKTSPPPSIANTEAETITADDPLFKKYSRKKTGRGGAAAEAAELRVGNVTSGLALYNGTFGDWEKKHLVNRLTPGFRFSDLALLNGLSVSQAVDLLVPLQANMWDMGKAGLTVLCKGMYPIIRTRVMPEFIILLKTGRQEPISKATLPLPRKW
jgi:hypothetical protein